MMLDPLRGERQRTNLRRLVRERGPDDGREVSRLTIRGHRDDGALLDAYDANAIPLAQITELSVRDSASGYAVFLLDVSTLGGADGLE
ncbi:MAG: hypothetical protein MOGMAGMI_02486 [Candidatus Omnitrophica bacterium]|nr:hypothetical protein [Candidatus Omnitrophota bacterium]